jgi:hypothetical protein
MHYGVLRWRAFTASHVVSNRRKSISGEGGMAIAVQCPTPDDHFAPNFGRLDGKVEFHKGAHRKLDEGRGKETA